MKSDRRKKHKILVSGSIHLDLISEILTNPNTTDSQGTLSIEVGGTSYNVASNLQFFDNVEVFFHTALKPSPISQMLEETVIAQGITPLIEYNPSLLQSGFSAHIHNKDIRSAVSTIAIEQHQFEQTSALRDLVRATNMVVIDCNHNIPTIDMLIALARDNDIPTSLCGVSEGKALKITALKYAPDYFFINASELRFIQQTDRSWWIPPYSTMVVTDGPRGAIAYKGSHITETVEAKPVIDCDVATLLGAGDGFASGYIYGTVCGTKNSQERLEIASKTAQSVICSRNCNMAQDGVFDAHIKNLNDKVKLGQIDQLTQLATRRPGIEYLEKQHQQFKVGHTPFSLIMMDLDKFKSVNDEYGHDVGDIVLIQTAKVIRDNLREADMPIRWGGEEFIVVLPHCTLPHAIKTAERIKLSLYDTFIKETGSNITASMGCCEIAPSETLDEILKRADTHLYTAKESGRNCIKS